MKRKRPARGMTLIEFTAALLVLTAVGLLSVRLIGSTIRTGRSLAEGSDIRSQYDRAMGQLRRDVWGAAAVHVRSQTELEITDPAGRIVWAFQAEQGRLTRSCPSGDSGELSWPELRRSVSFEPVAAGVRVRWTDPRTKAAVAADLPSQVLLAGHPASEGTGGRP